jgi:hypothetical protein
VDLKPEEYEIFDELLPLTGHLLQTRRSIVVLRQCLLLGREVNGLGEEILIMVNQDVGEHVRPASLDLCPHLLR